LGRVLEMGFTFGCRHSRAILWNTALEFQCSRDEFHLKASLTPVPSCLSIKTMRPFSVFRAIILILVYGVAVLEAAEAPRPTVPRWSEILGPTKGTIPPAPSFKVDWRTDLASALAEAKEKQRPLFVTLRCLPCKQCAEFDKEVLDGGSDLDPLLAQFITVRLTNAAAIDLRIFPVEGYQDLDLSW
jgi:Thioredoxin-like